MCVIFPAELREMHKYKMYPAWAAPVCWGHPQLSADASRKAHPRNVSWILQSLWEMLSLLLLEPKLLMLVNKTEQQAGLWSVLSHPQMGFELEICLWLT